MAEISYQKLTSKELGVFIHLRILQDRPLSSMFTEPDYRRRGIAKALLSRIVPEAAAYGCGACRSPLRIWGRRFTRTLDL